MRKIAAALAVPLLVVALGASAPAEAQGKHKGWTTATVCSAAGQPTLTFAGSAGVMACPVGYYEAKVVRVHKR